MLLSAVCYSSQAVQHSSVLRKEKCVPTPIQSRGNKILDNALTCARLGQRAQTTFALKHAQ